MNSGPVLSSKGSEGNVTTEENLVRAAARVCNVLANIVDRAAKSKVENYDCNRTLLDTMHGQGLSSCGNPSLNAKPLCIT